MSEDQVWRTFGLLIVIWAWAGSAFFACAVLYAAWRAVRKDMKE